MSLLSNRVGNTAGPKPRRGLSLLQGRKRQAGLKGISSELVHVLACTALWHQEVTKHHFFQSKDRSPCRSLFQVPVSPQTRTTKREKRQVPTTFKSNKRSAVLYTARDASSGQTLKRDKQRKRGTKRWHMALDQLLALFTVRSLHCRAGCTQTSSPPSCDRPGFIFSFQVELPYRPQVEQRGRQIQRPSCASHLRFLSLIWILGG